MPTIDRRGSRSAHALAIVTAAALVDRRGRSRDVAGRHAGAGRRPVRELVGQRFVVAMRGNASLARAARPDPARRDRRRHPLRRQHPRPARSCAQLTATLQRAARAGGRPPLLIATDQEGGARAAPSAGQARADRDRARRCRAPPQIRREARQRRDRALRAAGVNVDLAPVADVPAPGRSWPREERTFGASTAGRGRRGDRHSRAGLADARVAAAVKHFPGIGRATQQHRPVRRRDHGRAAPRSSADLVPFRAAIAAGAPIVMISNASYPALDAKPAPWSPRVQALLRDELGFTGRHDHRRARRCRRHARAVAARRSPCSPPRRASTCCS